MHLKKREGGADLKPCCTFSPTCSPAASTHHQPEKHVEQWRAATGPLARNILARVACVQAYVPSGSGPSFVLFLFSATTSVTLSCW